MDQQNEGGGSSGEEGGIGAGGHKQGKPKLINQVKIDADARRKMQQNHPPQVQERQIKVYADGSTLTRDLCHLHPTLLDKIHEQTQEDCWALAFSTILQFKYNVGKSPEQQLELNVQKLVRILKKSPGDASLGNMRKAIDYISEKGIEKNEGRQRGGHVRTIKGTFVEVQHATSEAIVAKLEFGPVGIVININPTFRGITSDEIYNVPRQVGGKERHAMVLVGHGRTNDGRIFFDVQNTWGTSWGVEGHGRISLRETCYMFYLDELTS